jgi:hypothetical protein
MEKYFIWPLAVLLFIAAVGSCPSANAQLVIVPDFDSSITSDTNAATIEATINTAISNIEGNISNPVTVYIDFGEMTSGLGQSDTDQYVVNYNTYLSALETGQTLSAADTTALASLGLTAPYTSPNPTVNPVNGGTTIQTTGAVLRAIGLGDMTIPSSVADPDSTIDFNSLLVDDSTGTPPHNEYSLESVVTHEMDEVLGIGGGGSQLNNVVAGGNTLAGGAVGPLDLFRYGSAGVRSYTTTPGPDPYFSINGGVKNLDYFNQNGANDDSDFSDWGNGTTGAKAGNTPPQVQDAYGAPGTAPSLGLSEMTALDVVGWNLTYQGEELEGVPEPSGVYLLLGGVMVMGVWGWRRAVKSGE